MTSLSLRARLTMWYTLALAAALGLFGTEILWTQQRLGTNRIDRELDATASTVWNVVRSELQEHNSPAAAAEEARSTVALPGRAVAIFDAAGRPLTPDRSGSLRLDPAAVARLVRAPLGRPGRTMPLEQPGQPGLTVWTVRTTSGGWRVRAEPQTFESTTLLVIVAGSLADLARERQELLQAMFVGIPAALLLAGVGGLWIASLGLRPIARMARLAGRIPLTGMEDLGHTDRSDELGQLARAFNALVARLRVALQTQRQFMADASHELRTPVSVIRAAADVALRLVHREEPEYREALAVTGDQARRLGRLVEDMLVLARADAGGSQLRPVDLYLDEVITECRRAVEVLAAERGVAVGSPSLAETPFCGDEDLLRRMIVNLLQNAVQHTPAGGRVEIELDPGHNGLDPRGRAQSAHVERHGGRALDPETIRIRVTDEGPGIPEADRARIFDRFVQLDGARRGSGAGLGLPIARWIAEAHGGTLVLESSGPRGSTFCVSLPGRARRPGENQERVTNENQERATTERQSERRASGSPQLHTPVRAKS